MLTNENYVKCCPTPPQKNSYPYHLINRKVFWFEVLSDSKTIPQNWIASNISSTWLISSKWLTYFWGCLKPVSLPARNLSTQWWGDLGGQHRLTKHDEWGRKRPKERRKNVEHSSVLPTLVCRVEWTPARPLIFPHQARPFQRYYVLREVWVAHRRTGDNLCVYKAYTFILFF